ncbi:PREDICTED: leucine-rich repeat-containing protein 48-like [Polistes canadensis]|uniref:leucine-rich repeat-containing protein 48-like n=1 Tax=Polistes canadensis TaxID=91411 RepID=UPI000718EA92|nr:PREDICTED: leucine-rich repeat-containing protein 48-like [Polistes canadensis]
MMYQENVSIASKSILEPGVINEELLIKLSIDQGPKGDAGKHFLEDGIKLDAITEIRIEFHNILKIDHLWVMPNLKKLHLSNNIIEKIENLDALVHLKELDLSFNHIKVMENLNHLIELEILLLFNNHFSKIEGIDNLHKLHIFSIGNNQITDWEHVIYLRKFKRLCSFNINKNPCTEKDGYQEYLIALIPQLIYYQYKMITKEERQSAVMKHQRMISNIEEEEAKTKKQLDEQETFKNLQNLLSKSYVEYLNDDNFFWQMFLDDKEGKDLSAVNNDTKNAFEEYRNKISSICYEFYEIGLKEQVKRDNEIKLFNDAVNDGKSKELNDSRDIVDELINEKVEVFSQINLLFHMLDDIEMDDMDDNIEVIQDWYIHFNDMISKTWTKLMSKEVILHDQLVEINEVFKINMTNMIEQFLETAREYFSQMRHAEAEYNDNINSIISYFISGFGDESKIPRHLLELCGDKETLSNNLAASHDLHLHTIDAREDRMLSRLKTWLNDYCEKLYNKETIRHRQKILEISHFLEDLRKQFNSLVLLHLPYFEIDNISSLTNNKNN